MIRVFICLLLLSSCQKSSQEEFQRSGEAIVSEIIAVLSDIQAKEDCLKNKVVLKKNFRRLTSLMVKAADFERKHGMTQMQSVASRVYSDQLYYQMIRIAEEVEGGRFFLEELQQEMLDKLDIDQRKSKHRRL